MTVNYQCLRELENQGLFENSDHRARFSELISCYCNYPFFTKGLCKCMYLSSWDMEHFIQMLDILNNMTLDKSRDVELMKDNGKVLEYTSDGYDKYIFQMCDTFLNDEPYEIPDAPIAEEGLYIMQRGLLAAQIIERIFREDTDTPEDED